MKSLLMLIVLNLLTIQIIQAQNFYQYFDGADTICEHQNYEPFYSICIDLNEDSTNIWQIGMPQKTHFNSAATLPNVIITDTIQYYPPNNQSSFQFTFSNNSFISWGITAVRWKQKIDFEWELDGGKIEFSQDNGQTWQNVYNNPYIYNFFGYDEDNITTLQNGDFAFSGTDTNWRDVWLCFDMSWVSFFEDSLKIRFTFISDSIENQKEGWMIDNIIAHTTFVHTVNETDQEKYIKVYPNPTSDLLFIETRKIQDFHIIEEMDLINSEGQVIDSWKNIPTKFFIKTANYSNGNYFLKIKTNVQSETIPVIIQHD